MDDSKTSLLLHGKLQTILNNNDKHIFMRVAIAKVLSQFQMHEHVVVIFFERTVKKIIRGNRNMIQCIYE
jgi:hypothetical protein